MIWLFRIFLYPFATLYGIIMLLRNKMFDWGILPSQTFTIPLIGVGNLSVGGTGKTPHVEYLVRLLEKQNFKVAVLSRGYGRRTKGFILAQNHMSTHELGDEVLQYKNKFKNLVVAACENRVKGVKKLLKMFPELDVILLDDVYQHRYIKPGINILLTPYSNLFIHNFIFPTGRLREFRSGAKRADIICVSKSPKVLSPIVVKDYYQRIKPQKHQRFIFSFLAYEKCVPLYNKNLTLPTKIYAILMVTGIANPSLLEEHLTNYCSELFKIKFRDHHNFKKRDIEKIIEKFNNIYSVNKIIVTTEKDAKRLDKPAIKEMLQEVPVFYIPIKVQIHEPYKQDFDNQIIRYVERNSYDKRLHQAKDKCEA